MTIRTFIALEIPDEALDKLIKIRDDYFGEKEKIRWESKDKLHITLKFLGDTQADQIDKIEHSLEGIAENYSGLDLTLNKFGTFIKDKKPRILWAGFGENESLLKIYGEIENSTAGLGFQIEERRFNPHLTLLRLKGNEDADKIFSFTKNIIPEIGFHTDKLSFIKSELKPSGSVFTVLKNFYLKK